MLNLSDLSVYTYKIFCLGYRTVLNIVASPLAVANRLIKNTDIL